MPAPRSETGTITDAAIPIPIPFPQPARFAVERMRPARTFTLFDSCHRVIISCGNQRIIFGSAINSKGKCTTFITHKGTQVISDDDRRRRRVKEAKHPIVGKSNATDAKELTLKEPNVEIAGALRVQYTGRIGNVSAFSVTPMELSGPIHIDPVEYFGDFDDLPL